MISSAIIQTFLLIVFSMSCHICGEYGYDYEEKDPLPVQYYKAGDNLCNPYYRSNFEIKNIFNLDQDIYVQSKDERGVYQMWRIPIISYKPESNKSNTDINPHHSSPSFAEFLNKLFDLEKPISGFPIHRIDWPHILRKCFQIGQSNPADEQDCHWIEKMGKIDIPDFICIYGTDKLTGNLTAKPILHRPIETKKVDDMVIPVKDDQKDIFNNICSVKSPERDHNPNEPTIFSTVSLIKWHSYRQPNMDVFVEEAVPRDKPEKYNPRTLLTVQMYDRKGTNVSKVFNVINERKDVAMGFYYNDFVKFLFCGQPCYLDSPLKWTTDFETPSFWFNGTDSGTNGLLTDSIKFKYITKNQPTLRTLINCESFDYRPFQPNDFCSDLNFLSIFNLGKDVYFQRSGRFWKYNSNGFTSDSNPFAEDLDVKISPVRYDSDFTRFLENEGFDTSSKIVGFNFKSEYQDFCGLKDGNCQYKHIFSEYHFKVCLYGMKGRSNRQPIDVKFGEVFYELYSYSPLGMFRILRRKPKNFCHKFMTSVLGEWGGDAFEHFSVTNPTNDTAFHSGYNDVYSFNKMDARKGQVFVRHRWKKDKPDFNYNGVTQETILQREMTRPLFIFSMNGQVWGYSAIGNGDLRLLIENHQAKITYMEEKIGANLFDLLKCPFISSTSVMTPKRQHVCNRDAKRETESTFYIGSSHYHQIGRYFYEWSKSQVFYYDKQVTNLLNDHFDTTKRVMGYSFSLSNLFPNLFPFENQKKEYAIVIYGTSHQRYRRLGKKVYGLFRLNEEYMPTLIAVNDLRGFPMSNTITFGSLIPDSKAPKILCYFAANSLNKDMKNESTFFTYIEDFNDSLIFRLTNHLSQLNYPFDSSANKPDDWFVFTIRKTSVHFQQIVGFSHHKKQVNVVAKKNVDPNDISQYNLATGTDGIHFHPDLSFTDIQHLKNNSWSLESSDNYLEQYCAPEESGVESETANRTLTSILVFILLVLLITALIVGITGYFRNEKNSKKVVKISEPNAVKPTQSGSNLAAKPSQTDAKPEKKFSDEKSVRSASV